MKQFITILKFELSYYFKNKVFIGFTVVLILGLAVVLSFPRIAFLFESKGNEQQQTQQIMLNCDNETFAYLSAGLQPLGYKAVQTDMNETEMKAKLSDGTYERGVIVTSPTSFVNVVKDVTLYDTASESIQSLMASAYQNTKLVELGASADEAAAIMNVSIESSTVQTGKNQADTFFYTYILIFTLYIAILLYGQFVTTSVATEKSSRAMELLITSAKPVSLMFGKVLGSGLAGLSQLAAVLGSAFIFFNLNKSYWVDNAIVNSIFNIPGALLGYMLLFFILGFFSYAFLYGAIGSLASKLEDINTTVMPVTFLFIAAFMVVMFSMTSGNIDNPLMVFCSYFPLTSSMAMFTRIAMGNVAGYEIIISVLILFLSTIGIGYVSAKIYRVGVLLYGTKPKLGTILKNLHK